jgi:hypothetical protein
MAAMAQAAWTLAKNHLSIREGLSGVFGSVSLATWIFLLVGVQAASHMGKVRS